MLIRSWIAFLLLINYLLVVGAGCISRPEDQRGFVMVQTSEEGHAYQECRYLRMDGLENFLIESLSQRYQANSNTPQHHIISVVFGVDAHYLTPATWQLLSTVCHCATVAYVACQLSLPAGVNNPLDLPPWLS